MTPSITIYQTGLLAIYLFLIAGDLIAQTPRHLGTKNKFPIGENNVPARIYILFLEDKISQEDDYSFSEKCYDSSFMTINGQKKNPYACIQCDSGWFTYYNYSVIPGHEEDIIDAVSSDEIQSAFKDWAIKNAKRFNHTRLELCNYINNKIEIATHPNSSEANKSQVHQFENSSLISKELQQIIQNDADLLVDMICFPKPDEDWVPVYLLNFWGLIISLTEDVSFPDIPEHIIVNRKYGGGNDQETWATTKWSRDSSDNNVIIIDHKGDKLRIEHGKFVNNEIISSGLSLLTQ